MGALMRRLVCAILLYALGSSSMVIAAEPTCHTHSGGPYCNYTGKVYRAYINMSKQILLYFDTHMDLNRPSSVGISGVTSAIAAIYPMTEDPDFGKALYASLLQAQARDATITIQMRGTSAGYLKIDRIWVNND